jgi:hypothetical protein
LHSALVPSSLLYSINVEIANTLYAVLHQRGWIASPLHVLFEAMEHFSPGVPYAQIAGRRPPQLVLQEKGMLNFQCARAPSQLCIFSKLVGEANLIFFDLEHGTGRELTRTSTFTNADWTLSPDGRKLAHFLHRHQSRFLSLDT